MLKKLKQINNRESDMKQNLISIFKGGVIATAAMTMLMLLAPMMGMPEMPIGGMLAGFMGVSVWIGWVMHFVIGAALAAAYVILWKDRLPGSAVVKGLLFSLIPFLMAQIIVMPMMGAGLFSANTTAPLMMVMGSLLGHLVYGAALGPVSKS
jgi:uncharacterized membrane protein YagU involved in acid resistance